MENQNQYKADFMNNCFNMLSGMEGWLLYNRAEFMEIGVELNLHIDEYFCAVKPYGQEKRNAQLRNENSIDIPFGGKAVIY